MNTCDVAVIGAGLVGAACAYELAASGLRVAVVEHNAVASGGTNAGYGQLSILDETPALFALTRWGLELWEQMAAWLPPECEYKRCGTVWVARDETQWAATRRCSEFFLQQGLQSELLDGEQLREAEPGLADGFLGGFYVANDACFNAARAAEFLLQLAFKKGAALCRQKAIAILEHEVRLGDGSVLYAGNVVNAAGSDAGDMTPGLPLRYSKGHVLVVETSEQCVAHQVCEMAADGDEAINFAARQQENGEVWIGSSHQTVAADVSRQAEPRIVAAILRKAIESAPSIGRARPQRSWTGLRVTTPDGLPLIGRVSGKESLFAAVGHGSYGATAALATARLIAGELLLKTPEIDAAPYLASRFERKNF